MLLSVFGLFSIYTMCNMCTSEACTRVQTDNLRSHASRKCIRWAYITPSPIWDLFKLSNSLLMFCCCRSPCCCIHVTHILLHPPPPPTTHPPPPSIHLWAVSPWFPLTGAALISPCLCFFWLSVWLLGDSCFVLHCSAQPLIYFEHTVWWRAFHIHNTAVIHLFSLFSCEEYMI